MHDLLQTNADICTRMAATVKTPEIRQQWNELATQWRLKAEAQKPLAKSAVPPPIPLLAASPPTSPEGSAPQSFAKPAEAIGTQAPKAELRLARSVVSNPAPHHERAALEAIWQAIHSPSKSAPSAVT